MTTPTRARSRSATRPRSTRSGSTIGNRVCRRTRRSAGSAAGHPAEPAGRAAPPPAPIGQHGRGSRMQAYAARRGQRGKPPEQRFEPGVAEAERIAARQDRLARPVLGEPLEGFGEIVAGRELLRVGERPAEAIPAMHGAGAGRDEQRPAVVLAHDPASRELALGEGVGREARDGERFVRRRQNLQQQRVTGIALPDAGNVRARHEQREVARGGLRRERIGRELEQRRELADVAHRIAELALPRCPGRHRKRGGILGHAVRSEARGGIICRRHSRMRPTSAAAARRSRQCAGARSVDGPRGAARAGASLAHPSTLQPKQSSKSFMASYSTNEFRAGLKVLIDNDPYVIVENEFVKPGKGQAFNRVKLRNLKTGRVVDKTFKSGESVEAADVIDQDMQYLYTDGEFWHFMVPDTYEQFAAGKDAVGDAAQWLKEQDTCQVTLWNGQPLLVSPPNHVELKVVETD